MVWTRSFKAKPWCAGGNVLAWPTDQINQTIRPTEAQAAKVQLLQSAAAQAAEIVKAACPTEAPSTPPARLRR